MNRITVLQKGKLLTMDYGPELFEADLWLKGGRIWKITLPGEKEPEGAAVYDCRDCVIMPGLIDSHVHYDESYMGDFFLANGITSVRNMRGFREHARWRDEILAGTRRGPYLYSSGPVYDGEDPTIPDNDNVILHTRRMWRRPSAIQKKTAFSG